MTSDLLAHKDRQIQELTEALEGIIAKGQEIVERSPEKKATVFSLTMRAYEALQKAKGEQ